MLTLVGDPWLLIKIPYQMLVCINCIVSRLVLADEETCSPFLSFCEWIVKGLLICSLLAGADTHRYVLCRKTSICTMRRMLWGRAWEVESEGPLPI